VYLVWARRFAASLSDRPLLLATREDAERFLSTRHRFARGIAAWPVGAATEALTILLGSVFVKRGRGSGFRPPLPLRWRRPGRAFALRDPLPRLLRAQRTVVRRLLGGSVPRILSGWGRRQDADAVRAFLERRSWRKGCRPQRKPGAHALVFTSACRRYAFGTRRVPAVEATQEIAGRLEPGGGPQVLDAVETAYRLPVAFMYGGGLRLMEALRCG